jgi:hypothetical protein
MNNPKYNINITYQPSMISGQQLVNISGVTQSMPTYSSEYFMASMPEVRLYATGSSYQTALTNLLILATASTFPTPGNPPLSGTKTW